MINLWKNITAMRYFFLLFTAAALFQFPLKAQQKDLFFQTGYYTDLQGKRVSGLIKYTYDYKTKFKYKDSPNGKVVTLRPEQVKGFVVDVDSFFVLNKFSMEGVGGGEYLIEKDFVQVIVAGLLTLGKHYSTQGNPNQYGQAYALETYLLIDQQTLKSTLVKKRNKKKFRVTMAAFFKDLPEVVQKIESEKYGWSDMPEIVRIYNQQQVAN